MLIKEIKRNQKIFKLFQKEIMIKGKKYKYTIEEWSYQFNMLKGMHFGIWAIYGTNNKKELMKLYS